MIANPTLPQLVAALYNGIFARAPEADGLNYWLNSGKSYEEIADGFINDQTFQFIYGEAIGTIDSTQLVNALYQNVLGRAPIDGDLDYWLNYIDVNGASDAAAQFVKNALTDDVAAIGAQNGWTPQEITTAQAAQTTQENKITVSLFYAGTLGDKTDLNPFGFSDPSLWQFDPAYQAAVSIISNVTDDPASVQNAIDIILQANALPGSATDAMNFIVQTVDGELPPVFILSLIHISEPTRPY